MTNEFITLDQAEKLTMKSRATLVRLSNKVQPDGYATKDEQGRWVISKSYLVRYYDLSTISRDAKQSEQATQSREKELTAQITELIERIGELTKTNAMLFRQNSDLMNENRQLLSQRQEDPNKGDKYLFITAIVVFIVALIACLFLLITN